MRPLLVAAALAASLNADPSAAQELNREAEVVVQVPSRPALLLEAKTVEVLENGQPREVLAVDRVTERWRIVVYFDMPGSTPDGVEAAAAVVGAAADGLVALGDVEVVTADRISEVVLEPTGDAEALRQAAADVGGRAGEAGGLLDLRREMREANGERPDDPNAGGPRTADLLEGFLLELDTLRWQRANLLESLQADSSGVIRPRVLLLVRDGTDLSADAFAQRLLGRATPAFARAALSEQMQYRSLARAIAALGWRAYPIDSAPPTDETDELLPGRLRQLEDLAHAGGGQVLSDQEELTSAIRQLGESWRVRYSSTGLPDGSTHPVNVRGASSATSGGPPPAFAARRWATVAAPTDLVALRANRALESLAQGADDPAVTGSGELAVRGVLLPRGIRTATAGAPSELVTLDGLVRVDSQPPASSDALRITIYGRGLDAPPFLLHRSGSGAGLDRGGWRFRTLFDLPTEIDELVLMVEDLRNDRWRVAFLEHGRNPLDDRSDVELLAPDRAGRDNPAGLTETEILASARSAARRAGRAGGASSGAQPAVYGDAAAAATFVRILPPRGQRSGLSGKKSFATVTTSDIVRRVEFYLNGELVFDDKRKPFETRIDLGPQPVPHTLRIVGYDRSDRRLGEDELTINQTRRSIGVGIAAVEAGAGGSYAVEAEVELARGRTLDRVEFYRNDRLAATMTRPPFRTVLPGPAAPGVDFARIAVYFDDGTTIEDVEFLSSDNPVAETIVNLVEIYVIVNDDRGKAITTLTPEDFVLRAGKSEIPIERFAVAEDVPLVLGLAVDSSESMYALMPDTRRAAARFLGSTLTTIDQAFLVDFDDRPRLLADTTADVGELIRALNGLQADGLTALYDAMQFCLVHLARDQGRRALVVLTDGDDYGSQSSYRRTFRTAGNTGVPIYVISMGQIGEPRGPGPRKLDLEAIAEASGGRVFYVAGMDDMLLAYEGIGGELRSQYMLGYSTSAPLVPSEVQSLQVELRSGGRDREVRMAVGRGRG